MIRTGSDSRDGASDANEAATGERTIRRLTALFNAGLFSLPYSPRTHDTRCYGQSLREVHRSDERLGAVLVD